MPNPKGPLDSAKFHPHFTQVFNPLSIGFYAEKNCPFLVGVQGDDMNKLLFILIVFLPNMVGAAPSCTGECRNYNWNLAHNAFICAGVSCQCTSTTTQPCWNPCNDKLYCNTTQWSYVEDVPGIQKGVVYQCSLDTSSSICNITTRNIYRCAAGYYGGTLTADGGCTSCAQATGNEKATSSAGVPVIVACYVPANTEFSFSDDAGTGTAYFDTDCPYTE